MTNALTKAAAVVGGRHGGGFMGRGVPDEQAREKLDELREQATARRDALEEARDDLRETTSEFRDLVRQYLPPDGDGTG